MDPRDPHAWMWVRAQEMLAQTERLRRHFFALTAREQLPCWEPPADFFETPEGLWIVVALPGVEARQIQINLRGTRLSVSAARQLPPWLREAQILRLELPHGRFERHMDLPPGRYQLIEQALEQGCLFLRLARSENTP